MCILFNSGLSASGMLLNRTAGNLNLVELGVLSRIATIRHGVDCTYLCVNVNLKGKSLYEEIPKHSY